MKLWKVKESFLFGGGGDRVERVTLVERFGAFDISRVMFEIHNGSYC